MYSSKKNVLETVSLLKAKGIAEVVLSPGSRNTPLIQSFASDPFFNCHSVVDERSAGFFALGIINRLQKPVAVCCTSGTALLNYGPAVAEAYYQELPLIVLSADRAESWIGQMDGQTLPQPGIYNNLVKKSVQLPEVKTDEDRWHCNRLLNEALNAATNGPVHINIPISEPLFDFSVETLPEVRSFTVVHPAFPGDMKELVDQYEQSAKTMILIGQLPARSEELTKLLEKFRLNRSEVVLVEHLGQYQTSDSIGNFDALISSWNAETANEFAPDLLITLGGHVVSKRVKKWLREHRAKNHWHIGLNGLPDTYQQVTHFIQTKPEAFFSAFLPLKEKRTEDLVSPWVLRWNLASLSVTEPDRHALPFSDITVTGAFLKAIDKTNAGKGAMFTGNSSPVRNLQLYKRPQGLPVFCNRGTSGIEGTLSTACGYAMGTDEPVFVLIGDLSFFYDLNILTFRPFPGNLRILLINNGGGAIFKQLPGMEASTILDTYVSASHDRKAKGFVEAAGCRYLSASNDMELDKALKLLQSNEGDSALLLEVFTEDANNLEANRRYYDSIKKL